MELIDKDALVAEIERRIEHNTEWKGACKTLAVLAANQAIEEDKKILSIINSLEVKDVDLEKEISFQWSKFCLNDKDKDSFVKVAKHFFELGIKAKDWEKERVEECPYRRVECTMYDGHILECKGACSWVVDYPKLKELKAQKGEEV